jgi:hypothetical protein
MRLRRASVPAQTAPAQWLIGEAERFAVGDRVHAPFVLGPGACAGATDDELAIARVDAAVAEDPDPSGRIPDMSSSWTTSVRDSASGSISLPGGIHFISIASSSGAYGGCRAATG